MSQKVVTLTVQPGIQRDGTQFAGDRWSDGLWVRFQRGLPKKIGGYRGIFLNASGVSRGMTMTSVGGLNYVVSGYATGLEQWVTDNDDGVGSGPTQYNFSAVGSMTYTFQPDANNLWQFDIAYDSGGGVNSLVAHPGLNLTNIDNTVTTRVLVGQFPGSTMSPVGVFTQTATTNATSTITINAVDVRIGAGQSITGSGIPANTTVVSVTRTTSTTTVVMSQNATASATVTLTFDNNIAVSGGCVVLHPYLFVYGDHGFIQNSSAGNFQNWVSADSNANNVATGKIVKGMPIRGGTSSPSGLFWSLDSLIRVSFAPNSSGTGYAYYWSYDLISSQTSIMSSQCVVEYDGIFYWMGTDRFLMYNGVVQEIDNQVNQNWIFDNLNYTQRQKVWATKVPRWGEIWWFYPRGSANECTDAIIYNVREKTWYDAGQAIGARRSAGTFSEVFRKPLWAGNDLNSASKYTVWQHETGTDQIYLNTVDAIQSYIESNNIGWVTGGPGANAPMGDNKLVSIQRIEPDFNQYGGMTVYVTGGGYATDVDTTTSYVFSPSTLKIDMREQRRQLRLRFESNTQNGNYEMGRVLLSIEIGDERSDSNP